MVEAIDETIQERPDSPEETQQPGSPEAHATAGARSRKRTKTGCLTCRKRRIKCGEERPICANCVKSKRSCEGYAPRLTFKDPVGAYPQGWPVRGYHLPPGTDSRYLQNPSVGTVHSQFPLIAPRPQPNQEYYRNIQPTSQPYHTPAVSTSYSQTVPADSIHDGTHSDQSIHPSSMSTPQTYTPTSEVAGQSMASLVGLNDIGNVQWSPTGQQYSTSIAQAMTASSPVRAMQPPIQLEQHATRHHQGIPPTYESRHSEAPVYNSSYIPIASHSGDGYRTLPANGSYNTPVRTAYLHQFSHANLTPDNENQVYEYFQQHPAIAQLYEEDEYYDVESDEEMPDADYTNARSLRKKQRDLHHVLAINGQGRNLRSVEAFLNQSNALANYAPRYTTSPLMDEATARIFCHFVTATGPLMSAYGRHPVNPALLFSGAPVPKSQQALWTYTIPMMAISNQALLHAILAVASLNIARLQQAPLTVPIKHYQFALRRVAKAVATPGKRTAMATVAATILLSQFEILSAEHSKWHSHLAGARQLLTEIDFTQWTDRIHHERRRRIFAASTQGYDAEPSNGMSTDLETFPWIPEPGSVDEDILNKIAGSSRRKVSDGQTKTSKRSQSSKPIAEKEMDDFQTYRDLFWMYTKIDNIQSFVSGRRLLLPLDKWIHCPPRAPMNRFDAIYGTLDHVGLLLGRVADFAGKDVFRKRQAVKANGGAWRPSASMFVLLAASSGSGPPGMPAQPPRGMSGQGPREMPGPPPPPGAQMPSPPSTGSMPSTPGQNPPGANNAQQANAAAGPPTFNGLLPVSEQATNMPRAFTEAPKDVLYQAAATDINIELNEATAAAEAEWQNIQEAFDVFEKALGPSFSPLPAGSGLNIDTAFGPALQYRTFQIATCWLLFYMAKIIAVRTHPSMPPASMVAAGVAAGATAQFCNIIGRINFGLRTPAPNQPLNPIFGGAITEMMLPMFVAGVQYIDNAQRMATIERLQFIADRIGHDSAALIAAGLEKTWIKMHEAGRGPKYSPSVRVQDEYGRDLTQYERNQPSNGQAEIRVPRGPTRDLSGRETSKSKSRGAVILQPDTRSFAAGVMGLEESFKSLNMDERQAMGSSGHGSS